MGTATGSLHDTGEFRRHGLLATGLYLVTIMAVGGAMWGFIWSHGAQRPQVTLPDTGSRWADDTPVIAGTGAALPLLHHLTRSWRQAGGQTIQVAPSIGSGGGLAALRDGVIDCAIVSRPLTAEERAGRVVQQLAMAPIVLAAGSNVPMEKITPRDLVQLVRPAATSDSSSAGFVLREPGDSGQQLLAEALPDLAAALADATAHESRPMAFTDADMERRLLARSNLIGVFDLGTIRLRSLPLQVLPIEGLSTELVRPFTLVCHAEHRLDGFLHYLNTTPVREALLSFGYQLGEN